jgi:ribose/xylose/arabinose/galactoside ABC-type transport system permease subunit
MTSQIVEINDVMVTPVKRLRKLLISQVSVVLLLTLIIAGSFLSDVFLSVQNFLNILWAVSVLGIVALGQTMLIIACRFDMSVAYSVGLCGIVTIVLQSHGSSLLISVLFGLICGFVVGFVNGVICVSTGANPFLVTLGTGTLIYAISLAITKSKTMYTSVDSFSTLGRGKFSELFGSHFYFTGIYS